MIIKLTKNGVVRKVKQGFSWTAFFFGFMPFFFRGMPGTGFAWFFLALLTLGLSNFYLVFKMNKMTMDYYLENGYKEGV